MSGKGSAPRPFSVNRSEFGKRWDNIFKKPTQENNAETKERTKERKE